MTEIVNLEIKNVERENSTGGKFELFRLRHYVLTEGLLQGARLQDQLRWSLAGPGLHYASGNGSGSVFTA